MGYHVVDPAAIDPLPGRPSETRDIREAVGLSNMGLRIYDVAPGEDVPIGGFHYHDEQEEVFYVIEGTLSVETADDIYRVETGRLFVADPGSPHRAFNDSESDVRILAVGAPRNDDAHVVEG